MGNPYAPTIKYIRIKSEEANKRINEFTLAHRPWTAYSADKIEMILWFCGAIPPGSRYYGFEKETDELIFAQRDYKEGIMIDFDKVFKEDEEDREKLAKRGGSIMQLDNVTGKQLPPLKKPKELTDDTGKVSEEV